MTRNIAVVAARAERPQGAADLVWAVDGEVRSGPWSSMWSRRLMSRATEGDPGPAALTRADLM